jgi:hypothetical protein
MLVSSRFISPAHVCQPLTPLLGIKFIRPAKGTVIGEALDSEIFITIRWAWLSFLAARFGLTIAFLVAVATYTSMLGIPVAKSSNLTELFAIPKWHMDAVSQTEDDEKGPKGIGQQVGKLVGHGQNWHLKIHFEQDLPKAASIMRAD